MRTMVIVGLVVGPVLLLGVPLALSAGSTAVAVPPSWTATGAFALAGVAALGGVVLLALSFRTRRPGGPARVAALPAAAPTALPAPPAVASPVTASPVTASPVTVPSRIGSRYVVLAPVADADPDTDPVPSPSRYVTLRTRRGEAVRAG